MLSEGENEVTTIQERQDSFSKPQLSEENPLRHTMREDQLPSIQKKKVRDSLIKLNIDVEGVDDSFSASPDKQLGGTTTARSKDLLHSK